MKKKLLVFIAITLFGCKEPNGPKAEIKISETLIESEPDTAGADTLINGYSKTSFTKVLDTIIIHDIQFLQKEIKSNRMLIIKAGKHRIDKTLRISNCKNLVIRGERDTEILLTDPKGQTMSIFESNFIRIEDLFIGHDIPPGSSCEQGVVGINHTKNILFESCELDGSGIVGLNMNQVVGLKFSNSTIQNCTRSIADFQGCHDIKFESSSFLRNFCSDNCFHFFGMKSKGISFIDVEILDNKGESGDEMGLSIFPFDYKEVTIESSNISNNIDMAIGLNESQIIKSTITN